MFGSPSPKVLPIGDDEIEVRPDIEENKIFLAPVDDHNDNNFKGESVELDMPPGASRELDGAYLKFLLKQVAINRRYERFQQLFSYNYLKETMKWVLDGATLDISFSFEDLTLGLTLFVLFADDIKILAAPIMYDHGFSIMFAISLFVFIFEFLGLSWSKTLFIQFTPTPQWKGYFGSFFWWLDLIAIISLFPDVTFIYGINNFNSNTAGSSTTYTKAGRVVRLVRLVRLIKVYKVASERRRRQKHEAEMIELVNIGAIDEKDLLKQRGLYNLRQSRLGDQLSESTTRRVIILVLLVLIVYPLLTYTTNNIGPEFATRMLHNFNTNTNISDASKQVVLDVFLSEYTNNRTNRDVGYASIIPMAPYDPYVYFKANLESLRDNQKLTESYSSYINNMLYSTEVIYSLQELTRSEAMYSILTTIFVAIILIGGALVFAADAEVLVIKPIERMMNMVEAVAADPLAPLHFQHNGDSGNTGEYEMRLLETTVEKITGLLRVGFGEAGANIISANLSSKDSSAAINPLLPGVRVYALFGFCDIHHFEDINRQLSNDVLLFVNQIAEIVHSSVHTWNGQCNKNLGNAFVIVWRIGDEHQLTQANRALGNRGRGASATSSGSLGSGESGGSGALNGSSTVGMNTSSYTLNGLAGRRNINNNNTTTNNLDVSTPERPLVNKMLSHDSASSGGINEIGSHSSLGLLELAPKKRTVNIDLRRVPGIDILADQALIGYCKIIAEINRNKYVMRYRNEPRLTDRGKKEFKVRMGFGLHAGWAIEGAVGSLQKVDATYLSPHVNMAARLETSSKQYGVPLLASQDFYDLLSKEGQSSMRRLDVVTVKGSEVPIGIYTYDALQDQVFKDDVKKQRPSQQQSNVVMISAALNALSQKTSIGGGLHSLGGVGSSKASPSGSGNSTPQRRPSVTILPGTDRPATFMSPLDNTGDIFEQDYDMLTLRKHAADPEFLEIFKEGVALYLSGDWQGAKKQLERSDLYMRESAPALGGDGPSQTLLQYMKNQNYEAPSTWKGYRPLTAK